MSGAELEFELCILPLGLSDICPVEAVYLVDDLHLYSPLACPVLNKFRLPIVICLLLTVSIDDLEESR